MSHEKFKIDKNKPIDTLIKPCLALDNIDSSKKVDSNLIYLDIMYGINLISRYTKICNKNLLSSC